MVAPTYSIVIPAYNEEVWLARSLPRVRQAMAAIAAPGEVIVVDNNSSDGTAEVARAQGATVVFEPVNQISRARNRGAQAARGRYLIFLDADSLLCPELLHVALDNLQAGRAAGGGAVVQPDLPIGRFARLGLWSWNWFSRWWGSAAGCFVYCLREGFDEVGGFSEKVYASEELWFSRALRLWANKRNLSFTIIANPSIITSNRKLERPWKVLGMVTLFLLFPAAIFSRRLCGYWYRSPASR